MDEIRNEIKIEAAGTPAFELEAFVRVFAKHMEDNEILFNPSIELLSCKGPRSKRLEIAGYSEDSTDDSLTVLVARYFGDDETLTLTEAKEVLQRGVGFMQHSLDGWIESNLEMSSREVEYASYFASRLKRDKISKIKFILLTDGFMSERIRTIESSQILNTKLTFEIWDQKRIIESDLPDLGSEDIHVDFKKWLPEGLPCLEANSGDDSTKTLLAVIPANVLSEIFEEYGSLLLESNVRTFLSARGAVNKGIQATLINEPSRFLAYNNGLTTTATNVTLTRSELGTRITDIDKWQIVNGGQTTASIVHFLRSDKQRNVDKVFVQMKLVLVEENNSSEIVQAVARYANSQNKVTSADLFATHDFHIRMEQLSRRIKAPALEGQQYRTSWFYERARGQWENDKSARGSLGEQKKFILEFPKTQKITKTYWSKYEYCWQMKPSLVSKGAESAFADFAGVVDAAWEKDDSVFNDGYFMEGVAKAIIYETLRSEVLKQDWYKAQNGYLANILAYAISRFVLEIDRKFPSQKFDLNKVWQAQSLSRETLGTLLNICREAQIFLNDPNRPQANVTQWAKQQACWERFKDIEVSLDSNLEKDLVSRTELNERGSEYRESRKLENEVDSTVRILSIPPEIWDVVRSPNAYVTVSPKESDLVRLFSGGLNVPSERQAKSVMALLQRFVECGLLKASDF